MLIVRQKIIQAKMPVLEKNITYADGKKDRFGIAVDIGTTTVAAALYEMSDKRLCSSVSQINCQTIMGKDVMMRLMHCKQGKQEKLHEMIIEQLEDMVSKLWRESRGSSLKPGDISKMTVVGNTTMCHLFLNKSTEGLTGSPFLPAYQGLFECQGKQIGFDLMAETEIQVMPGITAHVGSDAAAVILEESLNCPDKIQMAADIGTNAEIILNNRGKLSVCSAAAGPAFEGMGLYCGMRAEEGAVAAYKIALHAENIIVTIIGNEKIDAAYSSQKNNQVRGICGSGLVDIIAELVRTGLIRPDGYLLERKEAEASQLPEFLTERLVSQNGERTFLITKQSEVGEQQSKTIFLGQQDIRNFQMAKAAVQAGMKILLEQAGLIAEQIDELVIAGMFGSVISQSNGEEIGLFPVIRGNKLRVVGNAAGRGAAKALLEPEIVKDAEKAVKNAVHVELAEIPSFQKCFLKGMELSVWK